MPRGGKRPGSGRKPGPQKKEREKRIRQQISLPAWLVEALKRDHDNISAYIMALILADKQKDPKGF